MPQSLGGINNAIFNQVVSQSRITWSKALSELQNGQGTSNPSVDWNIKFFHRFCMTCPQIYIDGMVRNKNTNYFLKPYGFLVAFSLFTTQIITTCTRDPYHCFWLWKGVLWVQRLDPLLWSLQACAQVVSWQNKGEEALGCQALPAGPPSASWNPSKLTVAGSVHTLPCPSCQQWKTSPAAPGERGHGAACLGDLTLKHSPVWWHSVLMKISLELKLS